MWSGLRQPGGTHEVEPCGLRHSMLGHAPVTALGHPRRYPHGSQAQRETGRQRTREKDTCRGAVVRADHVRAARARSDGRRGCQCQCAERADPPGWATGLQPARAGLSCSRPRDGSLRPTCHRSSPAPIAPVSPELSWDNRPGVSQPGIQTRLPLPTPEAGPRLVQASPSGRGQGAPPCVGSASPKPAPVLSPLLSLRAEQHRLPAAETDLGLLPRVGPHADDHTHYWPRPGS